MILFPEGSRSRDGKMADFKPGVGMIIAGTSIPVVPCYLQGCREAYPPGATKPRLGGRIRLRIGQPRTYEDLPNDRDGWSAIAVDLQRAVVGLKINA